MKETMNTISHPNVNGGRPIPLITMGEKLPKWFTSQFPTIDEAYAAKELEEKACQK